MEKNKRIIKALVVILVILLVKAWLDGAITIVIDLVALRGTVDWLLVAVAGGMISKEVSEILGAVRIKP